MDSDGIWLRFLSGPDIDSLQIAPAEIVGAVASVVAAHGRGETVFEPRVHLAPGGGAGQPGGDGHFNVLRGHVGAFGSHGLSGVKVVGDFPRNYERGLPSEMGLISLYDPQTGAPLAVLDATFITAARTGAMTAAGARVLARPQAQVLGHAGARGSALWNVLMLDTIFDFTQIRVTSARPASREAFAAHLQTRTTTPVAVCADVQEAFDGADILVEATRLTAPQPLLHPGLVAPGALVVPYGTVSAVAPDLLGVIDKVVVDDWREAQAGRLGALRHHVDAGVLTSQSLHAELGQILTGARPGRESPAERILFWHRGLSILDVAVAHLVLDRAARAGAGTMLRYR